MIEVALINNLSSVDLQIHFYFENNSIHAMDAEIFNNCQRQFINALRKTDKFIDEVLAIEVTAREEGGLIDNIRIAFKHPIALILITALVTAFFSAQFRQKLPITEETKNKLENVVAIKEAVISGTITEEEFEYIASNDYDLKKLKSNFFKSAKNDDTISQVEIETSTQVNDKPIFNKIAIPYDRFDDFIIEDDNTEEIDINEDDDARIFIIAPVLVKGVKAQWKGYYGGIPIDFKINDEVFLELIYSRDIKFGNGTYIVCKLITVTTTKVGINKEIITREVSEVSTWGDDKGFLRPIKRYKKDNKNYKQGSLFGDEAMQ